MLRMEPKAFHVLRRWPASEPHPAMGFLMLERKTEARDRGSRALVVSQWNFFKTQGLMYTRLACMCYVAEDN